MKVASEELIDVAKQMMEARNEYFEYWIPGTRYYINGETLYSDAFVGSTNCYIVVNAKI